MKRALTALPLLIVAAVFGTFVATEGLAGIPLAVVLLGICWMFAVVLTLPATLDRHYRRVASEIAEACPRCRTQPRTVTGWCADCAAALHASTAPRAEPVARFHAATDADDWATIRAITARKIRVTLPDGTERMLSRSSWIRSMRIVASFFHGTSRHDAAYTDPSDPSVSWTRTRITLRRRWVGKPIALATVTRLEHDGQLLTTVANFAALPESGARPAGTMSAPEPA